MIRSPRPGAAPGSRFQIGNPGRPKGTRNKLSESFIKALCDDFHEHGVEAVAKVRKSDPSTYLRVIASLLPKEVEITRPLADLTDAELQNSIDLIRAAIAHDPLEDGTGAEPTPGGEPTGGISSLH